MKVRQSVVGHVCACQCLCVSALLSWLAWIVLLGKAGGINGITFQHTRVAHTLTHTHMANNGSSNNNSCAATTTTTTVWQANERFLQYFLLLFLFRTFLLYILLFFVIFCHLSFFHVLFSVVLLPRDPSLCTASSFRFLWRQHFLL